MIIPAISAFEVEADAVPLREVLPNLTRFEIFNRALCSFGVNMNRVTSDALRIQRNFLENTPVAEYSFWASPRENWGGTPCQA